MGSVERPRTTLGVEPGRSTLEAPRARPAPEHAEPTTPAPGDRLSLSTKPPALDGGPVPSLAVGLAPPAGRAGLVERRSVSPSATSAPPDYGAEIDTFAGEVHRAARAGEPVSVPRGERLGFWVGAAVSLPTQFLAINGRLLESCGDWAWRASAGLRARGGAAAVAGVALWPLAALTRGLGALIATIAHLLDLPSAGLRRALVGEHRVTPESEAEASHRRVDAADWPALPANAATEARVRDYLRDGPRGRFDVIVVPGITADDEPGRLSDAAKARLQQAAADLRDGLAPFILVSGGNVHPPGTPYNEAFEMRRYLTDALGVPADRILLEPLARHTTTNLRNAGRLMRRLGLERAVVTTSPEPFGQSFYLQSAASPFWGFDQRSTVELGTPVGRLERVDAWHTAYVPSARVDLSPRAPDPLDP